MPINELLCAQQQRRRHRQLQRLTQRTRIKRQQQQNSNTSSANVDSGADNAGCCSTPCDCCCCGILEQAGISICERNPMSTLERRRSDGSNFNDDTTPSPSSTTNSRCCCCWTTTRKLPPEISEIPSVQLAQPDYGFDRQKNANNNNTTTTMIMRPRSRNEARAKRRMKFAAGTTTSITTMTQHLVMLFAAVILITLPPSNPNGWGVDATLMSNEHQQQSNGGVGNNGDHTQQQPSSIQWEENNNMAFHNELAHMVINTTYISQILNRLTDKTKYDKRLRPRYGEGAVDVGITIHITSISAVSEVDMDFTLDFYLRQTWYDPRLAFAQIDPQLARRIKKLTVGVDYLDRLWKPDTFFPNEKTSMFHMATTPNTFLRIEPDGRIYTSQRMTVKAMCPMDLAMFPMDSQTCRLGLESYGYDVDDIDYYWGERRSDGKKPEDAVAFDDFFLPQFRRTGYRVTGTHVRTSSGEYARLYIEVVLTRNLGFYLMNIIIPSILIVSISWVSFWLSREASPARVGLGVTTVLTMTTLITTTNNSMPKVSYIKGLDVFLNFCFVMVFASLVEYAVVSYWNKRQCRRRDDRRERIRSAPASTNVGIQRTESNVAAAFSNATPGPGTGTGPQPHHHHQHLPQQQQQQQTAAMMMQQTAPNSATIAEYPMFMNFPANAGLAMPTANAQSYVYRAPGLLVASPVVVQQQQQQAQSASAGAGGGTTVLPIPPDCDCRLGNIPLVQCYASDFQNAQLQMQNSMPYMMAAPVVGAKMTRRQRRRPYSYYGGMAAQFGIGPGRRGLCRTLWTCRRLNPSKIDRLSRCCFPLLFVVFNLVYWSALTFMSQRELEKVDFVAFN